MSAKYVSAKPHLSFFMLQLEYHQVRQVLSCHNNVLMLRLGWERKKCLVRKKSCFGWKHLILGAKNILDMSEGVIKNTRSFRPKFPWTISGFSHPWWQAYKCWNTVASRQNWPGVSQKSQTQTPTMVTSFARIHSQWHRHIVVFVLCRNVSC